MPPDVPGSTRAIAGSIVGAKGAGSSDNSKTGGSSGDGKSMSSVLPQHSKHS